MHFVSTNNNNSMRLKFVYDSFLLFYDLITYCIYIKFQLKLGCWDPPIVTPLRLSQKPISRSLEGAVQMSCLLYTPAHVPKHKDVDVNLEDVLAQASPQIITNHKKWWIRLYLLSKPQYEYQFLQFALENHNI